MCGMTSRERVFTAVRHREPDGIPYEMRMEASVADSLDAFYRTRAWRDFVDNDIRRVRVLDAHALGGGWMGLPFAATPTDACGGSTASTRR